MSIRRLRRNRVTRGKSFLERKTLSLLNFFKKMNEDKNDKKMTDFIQSAETKIKDYSHNDKNSRVTSRVYNKLNTIERSLLRTINKITDKLEESGGDAFAEDDKGESKGYQNFRLFKDEGYKTSFLSKRFSSSTVSITRDDVEDMKEKLDSFREDVVEQKNEIASHNGLVDVYEHLSDVYDLTIEIEEERKKLSKIPKTKSDLSKKISDSISKYKDELAKKMELSKLKEEGMNLEVLKKNFKENIFDPWKKEYETLCSEWCNIDTESKFVKHARTGINLINAFWPKSLTQMLTKAIKP